MFSSLQCNGRGHAQNLFASRFALFQCILHAQLSELVPRYRTKSGVSRLIFPLQASPDRVFLIYIVKYLFISRDDYFENLRNTTVLAYEMFTCGCRPWLKNVACLSSLLRVTLRALASFSRTFLSRVQTKSVSVRKILCALITDESLEKVLLLNSLPNSY